MSEEAFARGLIDYAPCKYSGMRAFCRGPRRPLTGRYLVCLGGSETYGRFLRQAYPDRLEARLGLPCVNFGVLNAGLDLILREPALVAHSQLAVARVFQVPGAQSVSNRYYSVHARRNDRFLRASEALMSLYPEVDFADFSFVGHMLDNLARLSPERFAQVRRELQHAWTARMIHCLGLLGPPTILLWLGSGDPLDGDHLPDGGTLGPEPLFVSKPMLERVLERSGALIVIADPSGPGRLDGKFFSDLDRAAALSLVSEAAHDRAAEALERMLRPILTSTEG